MYHCMSKEEEKFLNEYHIEDYERPSIATDIVMFSVVRESEAENFRKLPEQSLGILLIKRGSYPYKGCWALPGGFLKANEDVVETAKRELYEETGIQNAYLQLSGIYGKQNRDPRGWIVSNTYMALFDGEEHKPRAGSDAWEARWFSIDLEVVGQEKSIHHDDAKVVVDYRMNFVNKESETSFSVVIREIKKFVGYHEQVQYEMQSGDGLAFDHGEIILCTLLKLRQQLKHDMRIGFDLMPECFTLTQLQKTFEIVLDEKLTTPNFRRKIAEYVLETEEVLGGEGHRPAKYFRRNIKAFYES